MALFGEIINNVLVLSFQRTELDSTSILWFVRIIIFLLQKNIIIDGNNNESWDFTKF